MPSIESPFSASVLRKLRGGVCVRTNAASFLSRLMVAMVGGVAFMSPGVGLHGMIQRSAARMAAAVASSSRPGVSMNTRSKPAFSALLNGRQGGRIGVAVLKPSGRRTLRVHVENKRPPSLLLGRYGAAEGQRGLPGAALLCDK